MERRFIEQAVEMSGYDDIWNLMKRGFAEKAMEIWREPFKAGEMCHFNDTKKCDLADKALTLCIDVCVLNCCCGREES